MALPFFYIDTIQNDSLSIILNEENSKHIVQVLRMQNGEHLQLTDGKGNLFTAQIIDNNKKKCSVEIIKTINNPPSANNIIIAISLIKNHSRFEWFLEKATEIGVTEIIPLICTRTEKQHFRQERMKGILISAMLQSQQTWLPHLHESVKYEKYIENLKENTGQKFIAHCEESKLKHNLSTIQASKPVRTDVNGGGHTTILIGPEGDFTNIEIETALTNNFIPVALGNTRLRTETAGIVAATLLCNL